VTAAGTVDGRQLDWLLVDFVRGTAAVRHALVVSADGLRLATSQDIDTALGDQLAAVSSGVVSLAQGVAGSFAAGPVRQTIIEMAGGYLFLTSISQGSSLAVFADRHCDMGMIGYEMTLVAARVGHMLTPARRPLRPTAPGGMRAAAPPGSRRTTS
jgi:predicted regulator of Ras-like GTPase activity (Roadblock/LC7/MglB family)